MRRLVCVEQTCPLTVSDSPLSTSCMVSVLAFDPFRECTRRAAHPQRM
jgi:hypothetical protein